MLKALTCVALIACGSKDPAPSSPSSPGLSPAESATTPLPPVAKVGDACRMSKDCGPLGPHHRCMQSTSGAACYESPMKICDAPDCSCFNNDPCVANDLGTCSGYKDGVVLCTK